MVLHKILKIVALIAGIIGLVFLGWSIYEGSETLTNSADAQANIINPYMYLAYIIFALTVILVLIYSIKNLFTGNVAKTFLSIGAFVALLIIGYLVAGDSVPDMPNRDEPVTATTAHWVSAGLTVFYILGVFAIGTMITAGIKKLIK